MDTEMKTTEAEELKEPDQPKVSSKRIKKAERREAKAARKAANKIEEKRTTPNNALIALLIFGVVIAMFAFVLGYNYFSKPATIAKYIEENGGEEAYGSMQLDAYTTAAITADGNSMNIEIKAEAEDKDIASQLKEYYGGDDGKEQLEYMAAYFLSSMKPQTRAFSADVKANVTLNGKELNTAELTYKEAKELMEKSQEDAEAESETEADAEAETDAEAEADTEAETEESGE